MLHDGCVACLGKMARVTINAEELLHPLRGHARSPSAPVVFVENQRIIGRFDLHAVDLPYLFHFRGCEFEDWLDVRDATVAGLMFEGCRLLGLTARNLRCRGDVWLGGCALEGGGAAAAVNLSDARVEGSVVFKDTRIVRPYDGTAVCADRIWVNGDVDLSNSVLRENSGRGKYDLDEKGGALSLEGAEIGGNLVLAFGAFDGKVNLRGATIARRLDLRDTTLGRHPDDRRTGPRRRIALDGSGLGANELWLTPKPPPDGQVVLRQARCETFHDSEEIWQATGGLDIDGFRYDTLKPEVRASGAMGHEYAVRLRRATPWFHAQPYDQLAAALQADGHIHAASIVLLNKHRQRFAKLGELWVLWGFLERVLAGYGYRPKRAGAAFTLLLVVAWLSFIATATDLIGLGVRQWALTTVVVVGCIVLVAVAAGAVHRLGDRRVRAIARRDSAAVGPAPSRDTFVTAAIGEEVAQLRRDLSTLLAAHTDDDISVTEATAGVLESGLDTLAVEAYLDTDNPLIARSVFTALDDLAEVVGYQRPTEENLQRGSWWRRSTARAKKGALAEQLQGRLTQVERFLELITLDGRQADVDVKIAEAVTRLMAALENVAQGCLRAGSILVVKYQGDNGPVILSRNLSQLEIKALERFPEIQTKPRHTLDSLATAVASFDDDPDEAPTSDSPST